MRKLSSLVLALTLASVSFSQQSPNSEAIDRHIEWCEQTWRQCKEMNWKRCKEMRLEMLSVEKECLERSQNYDAFRECMITFLLLRGREL
uniref:Uncharacterized protein n=1 Tax=Thermocrinis ruber TaxID=75906 RepID=A0A7C5X3C3_9AQUI